MSRKEVEKRSKPTPDNGQGSRLLIFDQNEQILGLPWCREYTERKDKLKRGKSSQS